MSTPPPHNGPDALLLDLGGVLIDVDFARATRVWSRASGSPEVTIVTHFSLDGTYEAFERGAVDASEYFDALGRTLGIALPRESWIEGWNAALAGARPGAAALVARLSEKIPVYLFSNTNAMHHARWKHMHRDLLGPVSGVFCSYEIGARKPDPEAFRRVTDRIGRPPGRILFLDDHLENVEGARSAGLRAEHVPDARALHEALTRHLGSGAAATVLPLT